MLGQTTRTTTYAAEHAAGCVRCQGRRWQECGRATPSRLTGPGPSGQEGRVSASSVSASSVVSSSAAAAGVTRLEITTRPAGTDALATATALRLQAVLGRTPELRTRKLYHLDLGLDLGRGEPAQVLAALVDPISELGAVGSLPDPAGASRLCVGLRPGVSDPVGRSVQRAAEDCLGRPLPGQVYTSTLYVFVGLTPAELERVSRELHNPLIQRVRLESSPPGDNALEVPRAGTSMVPKVALVPLRAADDATLEQISRAGMLALSLAEMAAIQRSLRRRGARPDRRRARVPGADVERALQAQDLRRPDHLHRPAGPHAGDRSRPVSCVHPRRHRGRRRRPRARGPGPAGSAVSWSPCSTTTRAWSASATPTTSSTRSRPTTRRRRSTPTAGR
jgi:hypothetical protein